MPEVKIILCQAPLATSDMPGSVVRYILVLKQSAICALDIQNVQQKHFHSSEGSVIGPDELPPPYEKTGGVPMVSCRVCQV